MIVGAALSTTALSAIALSTAALSTSDCLWTDCCSSGPSIHYRIYVVFNLASSNSRWIPPSPRSLPHSLGLPKLVSADAMLAEKYTPLARLKTRETGNSSPTVEILLLTASAGSVERVTSIIVSSIPRTFEVRMAYLGTNIYSLMIPFRRHSSSKSRHSSSKSRRSSSKSRC